MEMTEYENKNFWDGNNNNKTINIEMRSMENQLKVYKRIHIR